MTEINENRGSHAVTVLITLITDELTTDELAGLGLCLLLENDPSQLPA